MTHPAPAFAVPRPKKASGWRELVVARASYLRAQLLAVQDVEGWDRVAPAVEGHLKAAIEAATLRGHWGTRFRDWWNGALVDAAWINLHNAELLLVSVQPPEDLNTGRHAVVGLVERTLAADDRRRTEAKRRLIDDWGDTSRVSATDRSAYRTALQWGFIASDEQYTRVRSLRNLILATTVMLFLLAAGLAALGFWQPSAINLCFEGARCPTGRDGQPSGGDIALVEFLGLVGGALSAMVSIRGMRGTSTPYGVPVALALLKLPAGALISLTALLLLAGRFLPGLSALDSTQQIVGYALVLGYAQQLVTRLVDRQAQNVLNRIPSSEAGRIDPEAVAPPPSPPPAPITTQPPREPSRPLIKRQGTRAVETPPS